MRALVTGAGGFAGRYLVDHLLAKGDEVLGISLPVGSEKMPCQFEYFEINDLEAIRKTFTAFKPKVIYHLAGISFVPEAEEDFQKAVNVNVLGTSNIFRIAHLLELDCKIVLISSAEVYGKIRPEQLPISESTLISPANNYSLSKAMAELVSKRYSSTNLRSVIIRAFNHIGARQDSRFVVSNFARQLALIKLNKAKALIKVGNLVARRDFTDVRDIVVAYRLAAEKGSGVFNFASGKSHSISEILNLLISISGVQVEVVQEDSRVRPLEIPELYADITKAKTELGWIPQYDIKNTLSDIFNYWVEVEQKI